MQGFLNCTSHVNITKSCKLHNPIYYAFYRIIETICVNALKLEVWLVSTTII